MFQRPYFKTPSVRLALVVPALVALFYLDQSFSQAGLWLFVGLALTTGFFHGALDIVLLQREFTSATRLAGALVLYVVSAVMLAVLCAYSGWLMVLLLLAMSVWHFGEPYGRWAQNAWLHRIIAGGAPVMLPALLSAVAIRDILTMAVGADALWAWTVWQAMAWLWVGLCGAGLLTLRHQLFCKPLWAEAGAVFLLNIVFSPLAAFALYFGLLHASDHIRRVVLRQPVKAMGAELPTTRAAPAVAGLAPILMTSAATGLLLLALAWYLSSDANVDWYEQSAVLRWILIALTAVTLPHLILVSRCAHWLAAEHTSARP
jgi:Brp/Blh family beta-carotene 15,15'-monooxygenase